MDNRNQEEKDRKDSTTPQPEPGTLHTTDPQENMEGPVSSSMHGISDAFDSKESQREADEKADRNK